MTSNKLENLLHLFGWFSWKYNDARTCKTYKKIWNFKNGYPMFNLIYFPITVHIWWLRTGLKMLRTTIRRKVQTISNLSLLPVCKQKQNLGGRQEEFFLKYTCSLHHKHITSFCKHYFPKNNGMCNTKNSIDTATSNWCGSTRIWNLCNERMYLQNLKGSIACNWCRPLFPEVKQSCREAVYSCPSRAKVKKEWI
jgi:hypothetical protein